MGDWQQILFERRLLTWATLLACAGLGLWAAALATPHWLVQVPLPLVEEFNATSTPSLLLSPPGEGEQARGLIWAHSGIYSIFSLVEGEAMVGDMDMDMERNTTILSWQSNPWLVPHVPVLRSELIMATVASLLSLAAIGLSTYSVKRPYLMVRRLAAVLHLLVAACTITLLQVVDSAGHTSTLHPPSPGHRIHYGYSVLLAWASALVSLSVSLTFLCSSRKRKLLRNDNVTFRNQRLVITDSSKPLAPLT